MVGLRRRHLVAQLDPVGRNFAISATATLNAEDHSNRKLRLTGDGSTLQTYTLPLATGSGNMYEFLVQTTNSGTYVIVSAGSDEMNGVAMASDPTAVDSRGWPALAGDNFATFTFGDVTRGELGSWVTMTDVTSGVWLVQALCIQTGGSEATPFT